MYEITMYEKQVGFAQVEKEGLYYKFHCTCKLPNDSIHRIKVSDGQTERDLGICVPEGNQFFLTARIPVKYLKGERLSFRLVPQDEKGLSVPVAAGEPFDHLDKLVSARLQTVNGQTEILIDPAPDLSDSGQNPEPENRSALQ